MYENCISTVYKLKFFCAANKALSFEEGPLAASCKSAFNESWWVVLAREVWLKHVSR